MLKTDTLVIYIITLIVALICISNGCSDVSTNVNISADTVIQPYNSIEGR